MSTIYHVALADDWARAQQQGSYDISTVGQRIEQVGFLHACTDLAQVAGVIDRFYGGVEGELVLLEIDEQALARLDRQVRLEPAVVGDEDSELFPHVYGGSLPVVAVARTSTYPPSGDPAAHPTLAPPSQQEA